MSPSSVGDANHHIKLDTSSRDTTYTASSKIDGIPRRRSGLISDVEIRSGNCRFTIFFEETTDSCLLIALNKRNAVAPSRIIERSLSSERISQQVSLESSSTLSDNQNNMSQPYHQRELPPMLGRVITFGEADSSGHATNNDVDEGYVNVAPHTMHGDVGQQHQTSEHRQISASTSATSGTSSHLIHTREPTQEYTSGPDHSPTRLNRIRYLESQNDWLFQRNAELEEQVENMKGGFEVADKENRHRIKRLESSMNTAQATLKKAERQNRELEATIAQLRNPSQGESRASAPRAVPLMPIQQYRAVQLAGLGIRAEGGAIPASTSMTDSMAMSVSGSSQGGHSRTPSMEGPSVAVPREHHHAEEDLQDRPLRKKVSWREELDYSTTPRPLHPLRIPRAGGTTSILKTSPTKTHHDFNLPGSPSSIGSALSPPLANISGWVRSQPPTGQGWQGHRRTSDTPSLPGRPLFEEMGGHGLQPSTSQVSSTGFSTWRRDASTTQWVETDESGTVIDHTDAGGSSDRDKGKKREEPQSGSVLDHCKAVLEDRGSEFWAQVQFWCVVGVFVAGVLSRGKDGVLELGRRR